jgi:hypothetical protein
MIFNRIVFKEATPLYNASLEDIIDHIKKVALNSGYRTRISYPVIHERFGVRFVEGMTLAEGLELIARFFGLVLLVGDDNDVAYASLIERVPVDG